MRVAVEYRDETAFGQTDHSIEEIAEAIRHKKYGKDVREAIAQGFERIDGNLRKVTTKNEQLQKALGLSDDDLNDL